MKTHRGSCHCGRVEFEFDADEITEGLRCNCSLCKRLGLVFSLAIAPQHFRLVSGKQHLKPYRFGQKDITHLYCDSCGIYVYYESKQQCRANLGCVDAVDSFSLQVHFYDGEHLL